jgi:hypothetical protein
MALPKRATEDHGKNVKIVLLWQNKESRIALDGQLNANVNHGKNM